jgi:hypothetical protein
MFAVDTHKVAEPAFASSMFAMGGLLYGIGVLDAEEVMRYMRETLTSVPPQQEGRGEKQDG